MSTTVAPSVPYAGYVGTNMVSPATPFVDGTGALAPVSFRFLYAVFNAVNQEHPNVLTLQTQMAIIIGDVSTMRGDVNTLMTQMATVITDLGNLQTQANGLQTQINTINSRLAAAGIP